MPNPEKELGAEFPDEGISNVDFTCSWCHKNNNVPISFLKEVVSDAEASAMFLVYKKRWKEPMFHKEAIPKISNAAISYLVAKRAWHEKKI